MTPGQPIYVGVRNFLGKKDLVLSYYTTKCQFRCSYCALPSRSSTWTVPGTAIDAQTETVFAQYRDRLPGFQQFSFGNEGSVLDAKRFPVASLHYLLERSWEMRNLEVLSMETRPEYLHRERLEDIRARASAPILDVTVGFETQDDQVRQVVLRKNISRRVMTERVALLGDLGYRLTAYVMVKPAPRMTEAEGIAEAVATLDYLAELCDQRGVPFIAYLTPTYIAKGSYLHQTTDPGDWTPPTIQSVARVVAAGHDRGLPVYTGLWSEDMAEEGADFRGRPGYDPDLRAALIAYNKTQDISLLAPYLHDATTA